MEQGKQHKDSERISSKLFMNLNSSAQQYYNGQAARHLNTIGNDILLVSNSENKVDVFKRDE